MKPNVTVYLAKPPSPTTKSPLTSPREEGGAGRRLSQRSRVLSANVILRGLATREGLSVAYVVSSQRRLNIVKTTFSSILTTEEATVLSSKDGYSMSYQLPAWARPAIWHFTTEWTAKCCVDIAIFDNCDAEEVDKLLPTLPTKAGCHAIIMLAPEDPHHWDRLSQYYQARSKDYDIKYIS